MANHHGKAEAIDLVLGDTQSRRLLTRVSVAENGIGNLYTALAEYSDRSLSTREKLDEVARALSTFAENEEFNTTTKLGLASISALLFAVANKRSSQAQYIKANLFPVLSSYSGVCRAMKGTIRATKSIFEKVESRKKELLKASGKGKAPDVVQAEKVLCKAFTEASRTARTTNKEVVNFELQKAEDIKGSLLKFLKSEMALHARALELLTDAISHANNIDPETDLQILKSGLALHGMHPLLPQQAASESQTISGNHDRYRRGYGPSSGLKKFRPSWKTRAARNEPLNRTKNGKESCTTTSHDSYNPLQRILERRCSDSKR